MNKNKFLIIFIISIIISIFLVSCQCGFKPSRQEELKDIEEIEESDMPVKEEKAETDQSKLVISSVEKFGITLISVYDNYRINPELKTNWGFGCLVKTGKEDILFDTGGDSEILLFNMEKIGIDPKYIDKIVISHIHGDHIGGLEGFLVENSEVLVYIPSSFGDSVRNTIKSSGANFINVSGPLKISDEVWSTGELSGPPEEQSLVIISKKGLIIITGCAHPGVVNIIKKAKEMFPEEKIYLVLGGFHHPPTKIVKEFKELGVVKVAPTHCSGDEIRELFKEKYQNDFIESGVGKIINIE